MCLHCDNSTSVIFCKFQKIYAFFFILYKFIDQLNQKRIMASVYFQVTSSGYQKTQKQAPKNIDYSKQLPIYRTVHEFMNSPSQEKLLNDQKLEVKVETAVKQQKSLESTTQPFKYVRLISLASQKTPNIVETNSIAKDDALTPKRKTEKNPQIIRMPQKMSTVLTDTGSKATFRQYASDAKTEKSTIHLQQPQRLNLYYQLQKQRTLRKNLEKSYNSLLEKLNDSKNSETFDQQRWNFEQLNMNRAAKRHATQQAMTDRLKCTYQQFEESVNRQSLTPQKKLKNMRNSCCNFKHSQNSQKVNDQQESQLEGQKLDMISQRELLQQRVEEDAFYLKNRLLQMENKMLKMELYKKTQERDLLEKQHSEYSFSPKIDARHNQCNGSKQCQAEKTKEPTGKEHIHYLFTILVMFLCIALMSKK